MVDKITSLKIDDWDLTLHPRSRNSAFYDYKIPPFSKRFLTNDTVPEFKQRLVKNLDFKQICSECLFNLLDKLFIHLYVNGFDDSTNIDV